MSQEAREQTTTAAARKRAAVEMIARYEAALRRTARRYSFDAEDAEDAYQRALEIALTKAPTTDLRELIRWTQTVTKHEALAVRRSREKMLGYQPSREGDPQDPIALLPAAGDGPDALVERRESIARSREALQTLKPAELRALGLLAEGYSYVEIGEITGYSQTKINRLLAEGRARFRSVIAHSEDGRRCRELQPLLSAFCDGEAEAREAAAVREHLRACAHCRATMRTYRAAPRLAAGLLPVLPGSRSLLGRMGDFLNDLGSRLPGLGGGESVVAQVAAAGGSRGAGMAAIAKLLTLCAGAAAGAGACMATGVLPAPALSDDSAEKPAIVRPAQKDHQPAESAVEYDPAPPPVEVERQPPRHEPKPVADQASGNPEPTEASTGAVEYEPPPAPVETPSPTASAGAASSSGSAAGEFGP